MKLYQLIDKFDEDETILKSEVDLNAYDHIIVAFSGGKDSLSCILWLFEHNAPRDRIELWHHLVDGRSEAFVDWPVTQSYVKAIAKAFNLPLYFSWREGGFEGEMLKDHALSKPIYYETPEGLKFKDPMKWHSQGYIDERIFGIKNSTRLKFPALSATNLEARWCTAQLKIEVGRLAITQQDRFLNKKMLFISGERAEESLARAGYNMFEIHKLDTRDETFRKRWVDAYRPVHNYIVGNYCVECYMKDVEEERRIREEAIEMGLEPPKRTKIPKDRYPLNPFKQGDIEHHCPNCGKSFPDVWRLIEKYRITPHPCYELGWGRCSCACCIFSSNDQIASLRKVYPHCFNKVLAYEHQLIDDNGEKGRPIHFKRKLIPKYSNNAGDHKQNKWSKKNQKWRVYVWDEKQGKYITDNDIGYDKVFLDEYADNGQAFPNMNQKYIDLVNSTDYNEDIILKKDFPWKEPRGARASLIGPE